MIGNQALGIADPVITRKRPVGIAEKHFAARCRGWSDDRPHRKL